MPTHGDRYRYPLLITIFGGEDFPGVIQCGFLIPVAFLKIVYIPFDGYRYIPFLCTRICQSEDADPGNGRKRATIPGPASMIFCGSSRSKKHNKVTGLRGDSARGLP
jgi:hypothetical protein